MKDSIAKPLNKIVWILFILLLFLNVVNWGFSIKDDVFQRKLPFTIKDGHAFNVVDSTLVSLLENKKIVKIDTLNIIRFKEQESESRRGTLIIFQTNRDEGNETDNLDSAINEVLRGKRKLEITCQDSLGNIVYNINTIPGKNYSALVNIGFNALFLLFIFFNSYLLLRFSQAKENILIVLFLLLLACPNRLTGMMELDIVNSAAAGFLGIIFYHFVLEKLQKPYRIKPFYFMSIAIILICIYLNKTFHFSADLIIYAWSLIWLIVSFIVLWKAYKVTGAMELKRLLNAFKGLIAAIVALLVAVIFGMILYFMSSGQTEFSIYNLQIGLIAGLILFAMLVFIVCLLWFFGAFTWSLLTGTALGVKIRSTMIYTIVGVVFVVFFGLLDYSLGELLQKLFGRFMGSEFIAGIPATIGLLIIFNPVRNRVERIVDSKLNTSELDFLEKTDTFTQAIAGEGVVEGFEEYLCENLMTRLPIAKVALVSYDENLKAFKFNEIRGSDVVENSVVEDVHLSLLENTLQRNYKALNENPQEISSFALIIPIIYDLDHKWFLALGKKTDGTTYTKKDEDALTNLAAKIKLSLKFILAYEYIINDRHEDSLDEKDKIIARLQKQVAELAIKLSEKNISIEES